MRYATERGADLIVLGTHGYGPVKRFLLGHVADRVIRHAHCPVLAFPHETLRPVGVQLAEGHAAIPVGATATGQDEQC